MALGARLGMRTAWLSDLLRRLNFPTWPPATIRGEVVSSNERFGY